MPLDNRMPRAQATRRHIRFRPFADALEERIAPAIDLTTIDTTPYGVQLTNQLGSATAGVGFTSTIVGDIAQTGFQDVLVGAPTFNRSTPPLLGSGNGSTAYLVFGSNGAGVGNFNWAGLTGQQRVGDIASLGNLSQTNPKNGGVTFPYNGLTLTTSASTASQLGASAAAVPNITGTGINAFLVGAPNAIDAKNDSSSAGSGRAYLMYGGSSVLNLTPSVSGASSVDLDSTTPPTGQNVITFWTNQLNAGVGTAVASAGNLLGDGGPDVAISAPNLSLGGLSNNGAVFVIPASFLRTVQTGKVLLDRVGQPGGVPGVIFIGANSSDHLGSSLANAGNVNGARSAGGGLSDLLIGASNANSNTGAAYLVYGAANLASRATLDASGVFDIAVSRLGIPASSTPLIVAGATFNGTASGDRTGFAVSTAGDFNGSGFSDFMIGSPGFSGNTGLVTLVYGQANTSVGVPAIAGPFTLGAIPTTIRSLNLNGAGANAFAGFSLAPVQSVNGTSFPDILIGSPGVNANAGAAYLISGRSVLIGNQNLSQTDSGILKGITFTASNSASPGYLGTSVSGFFNATLTQNTLDSDARGDFTIGAPGYGLNGGNAGGSVFMLEGRFIPLAIPSSNVIPVTIGVGTAKPPFQINATTPAALQIFVFSNANVNPQFNPVTQIDTKTIVVNGVAYPNATIQQDPVDENGDGIPDAIITISPRSTLGLASGTDIITITGSTLASSNNPNQVFRGSATVQVTGGGGGNGGINGVPGAVPLNVGFGALPKFGSSLVPAISTLSHLSWGPLPLRVAFQQFEPPIGFAVRIHDFFHPSRITREFGSGHPASARGILTLGNRVFTRDQFHQGKHFFFTHKVPVVPSNLQVGFV